MPFPAGCTDPAHIDRWVAARVAGWRAKPRCARILSTGRPCGNIPLRGTDLCYRHLGGAAREAYDRKREPELILIANGGPNTGKVGRVRARAQLEAMRRRRLRRVWQENPLIEGVTVTFEPLVERQLADYLLSQHRFDIEAVVAETGWMPTPRCRDRIMRAAYYGYVGKSDHYQVARRLRDALGDDIKFYAALEKRERELGEFDAHR